MIFTKNNLLLFLLLILVVKANGQNSWIKWISTPLNESISHITKLENSDNYLFSISQGKPFPSNPTLFTYFKSYYQLLYKTDNGFNIIDSIKIKSADGYELFLYHFLTPGNDTIIISGMAYDTISNDFQVCMIWLDEDLNILKDTLYGLPGRNEFPQEIILNHYGNLVCHGLINPDISDSKTEDEYIQFFWEIDLKGNELQFVTDTSDSGMGGLISVSAGKYHIFKYQQILQLNCDFSIDTVYDFVVDNFTGFKNKQYINNQYIISGEYFQGQNPPNPNADMDISFLIIDETANVLNLNIFGTIDTLDRYGDFDFNDPDTIFIGGSKNYISGFNDTWFSIYKTNLNGEILFEKYYGGYGKYGLTRVKATNDGGCIIAGNWWDFYNYPDSIQHDVVIMKVDENGLINNLDEHIPFEVTDIIIYPNPGNDFIKINTALKNLNFYLFDIKGDQIMEKEFDKSVSISTSHLSSGIYFYSIWRNGKEIKSGKWIKQ
ncbi:MAG: T9SS type A sorting domain-containing protein [Bacteroidetes bacterium]|nr:T9SS type A sorting domain-containing protein [Bacteroidota bacterium]MBL7103245.1 T9SS type A sorting domain-containing protein [Bacteroidales bacterium]